MLIKLDYLVNKYNITFKGILHVGAHECEEIYDYEKYLTRDNILWIEAMNDKINLNKNNFKNLLIEQAIVSDEEVEIEFKCSNNGQSSSILDLGLHALHYPSIVFINSFIQKSKLLKNIIPNYNINFNFLNLDIQGAELKALIGMGDYLNNIEYIYTEVNNDYVYNNCALIEEIDNYLSKYNFIRVETEFTEYNWGDAFYIKKNIYLNNINIFNNCDENINGELLLYNNLKDKINIIFDVGCRNDSFFINFDKVVHYFDPCKNNIEKLKLTENKNKESYFNNFGLSDINNFSTYYPGSQSFHNRGIGNIYSHEYNTNTLLLEIRKGKDYIESNNILEIDFLKIDTEGHEFNVIKGFEEHLNNIKIIQFEYGGTFKELNIKLIDVINYLKKYNFTDFSYLTNIGYCSIVDFEDHYNYCNIICINKKYGLLKDFI